MRRNRFRLATQHAGVLIFEVAMFFQYRLHGSTGAMQPDLGVSRRDSGIPGNLRHGLVEHIGLGKHLPLLGRHFRQQLLDAFAHLSPFKP